ncbi:MAG: hypothetical protein HIU83_01490 [Proteobacteria bacterium]|nr:hypothetical protein [Pseudomonadota bacterium]
MALFASDDDNSQENPLVEMAAVRAAFMEQLANRMPQLNENQDSIDQAFMVGILSLLESIFAISIDEIITTLYLSEEVRGALTTRQGNVGKLLYLAELVEQMEYQKALQESEALGLSEEDVQIAQMNAYNWRDGML